MSTERHLKVSEIQEIMNCSTNQAYTIAHKIIRVKDGRMIRIPISAWEEWYAEHLIVPPTFDEIRLRRRA